MIEYKVRDGGIETFLEIINVNEEGYDVRIITIRDGYKKEVTEYLSMDLFKACLRTGYLQKIEKPVIHRISA